MSEELSSSCNHWNRREFLKQGAAVGGLAFLGRTGLSQAAESPTSKPGDVVRVGFVGVGGMGTGHVRNLLKIKGVALRAVCDIVESKVARAQNMAVKAGQPKPIGYSKGPTDFKRMCQQEDLDLVYTATPWEWHVPVCVAAMNAGKHAATEVPAAVTLDECWQLVETAEKTGKRCQMMENCCYGRTELMVLNMVRKGLLGELLHGECGYMHDLRALKHSAGGEGLWRRAHSIKRNGNLYPTHGLGPVAQCMNINRGDRFDYLVSMSTKSRGLKLYAEKHFPADHPRRKETYKNGDVNSTLIRTMNGCTIVLEHDCDTPRPYSRINLVQGTEGIFRGYPDRIHIEGRSPAHAWENLDKYRTEFEHPLWKARGAEAKGAGHGGMDYIEDYRMITCLRTGAPADQDVYDAAAWSVIGELTERSVASRSKTMDVPDFTKGKWKTRPPLGIVEG